MLLKMDRFALQKGVPTLKFFFFTSSFKRNVYLPLPSLCLHSHSSTRLAAAAIDVVIAVVVYRLRVRA